MKTNIGLNSLIICILFFMSFSCKKNYHLEKSFNAKKRYSIVRLYNGRTKIDSLYLFDYYDNLKITRMDKNRWFIYYNGPGGSGVSTGNSLLLDVKSNKIDIPIFINSVNSYYENKQTIIKDSLALNFNSNDLTIKLFKKKNKNLLTSNTFFANYSEEKHLFYNGKINLKKGVKITIFDFNNMKLEFSELLENGEYPYLKIDSTIYLKYNKNWFWLKNKNEIISVM